MASPILYALLALLMIDSLIEVGLIGSTVGYLHRDNGGVPFEIAGPNGTLYLLAKPLGKNLSVNQGHTSNGAAGTALILVGVLGFLALSVQNRIKPSLARAALLFWVVMTVLSFLLTLSALAYTNAITNQTGGQSIDISQLQDNSANAVPYPLDTWTPQTWYAAVLQLPFVNDGDKHSIRYFLRISYGWRWNLIPLFLLGLAVIPFAVLELMKTRRDTGRKSAGHDELAEEIEKQGD